MHQSIVEMILFNLAGEIKSITFLLGALHFISHGITEKGERKGRRPKLFFSALSGRELGMCSL